MTKIRKKIKEKRSEEERRKAGRMEKKKIVGVLEEEKRWIPKVEDETMRIIEIFQNENLASVRCSLPSATRNVYVSPSISDSGSCKHPHRV